MIKYFCRFLRCHASSASYPVSPPHICQSVLKCTPLVYGIFGTRHHCMTPFIYIRLIISPCHIFRGCHASCLECLQFFHIQILNTSLDLFWGLHTKPLCIMIKYKYSIKMLLQQARKNEKILSNIFKKMIFIKDKIKCQRVIFQSSYFFIKSIKETG